MNVLGDPTVNLLAISLTALILCGYNSMVGGVYKSWLLNLIEVLNLGILSATAYYQIGSDAPLTPVTYISTGTALAVTVFVTVVLYHVKARIVSFKWGQALQKKFCHLVACRNRNNSKDLNMNEHTSTVTSSSVDLRELRLSV